MSSPPSPEADHGGTMRRRLPWRSRVTGVVLFPIAALLIASLAACDGDTTVVDSPSPTGAEPTDSAQPAAGGETPTAQPEDVTIELTEDGFAPDSVAVPEGSRVTVRNATDSDQSIVVVGAGEEGGDQVMELGPGESAQINLPRTGAYLLTLAGDPNVAGSVIVS